MKIRKWFSYLREMKSTTTKPTCRKTTVVIEFWGGVEDDNYENYQGRGDSESELIEAVLKTVAIQKVGIGSESLGSPLSTS